MRAKPNFKRHAAVVAALAITADSDPEHWPSGRWNDKRLTCTGYMVVSILAKRGFVTGHAVGGEHPFRVNKSQYERRLKLVNDEFTIDHVDRP